MLPRYLSDLLSLKSITRAARSHLGILALACCCLPAVANAQSSLEQIPVSGTDVASELGLTMTKFKARFSEPVHCLARLEIKAIGPAGFAELEARSPEPRRTTEILFSIKDVEFMQRQLGLLSDDEDDTGGGEAAAIPVSFMIKAETFATRQYLHNPFGQLIPGMSFYTWSPRHSTEDLPLDQDIPVFIKAGPYLGNRAQKIQDILQEYVLAPAYIRMTVRFSREPLRTKAEIAAEKERREPIEAALSRLDQLVEKAQAGQRKDAGPIAPAASPATAPESDDSGQ